MLGSQVNVVKAFEVVFFQRFTALNFNDLEKYDNKLDCYRLKAVVV